MAGVKVSALLVLCMMVMVVAPFAAEAALTCGQVQGNMLPCLGYLRGGGTVPQKCCNGVKNLSGLARTTPDRQTACKCLMAAAKSFNVNNGNAAALPGLCRVSIPYKISLGTDCSKVK